MSTMGIIASVVALSLVVHIGLFLWIRGRIAGDKRDKGNHEGSDGR